MIISHCKNCFDILIYWLVGWLYDIPTFVGSSDAGVSLFNATVWFQVNNNDNNNNNLQTIMWILVIISIW